MDVAHEHYYGNGRRVESVYQHAHDLPPEQDHEHPEYMRLERALRQQERERDRPRKLDI